MRMATRHRRWIVAVTVSSLVMGLALVSAAAPEKKSVVVDVTVDGVLSPTVIAGVEKTFAVTIYNTSDSAPLGAADIPLPNADFDIGDVTMVTPNWTATLMGDSIRIVANDSQSRIAACGAHVDYTTCPSVTVTVDLTFVQDFGENSEAFGAVDARQANNFNGKQNDLNFDAAQSHLGFTVVGEAVRCSGSSCQVDLPREGSTSLKVMANCAGGDCGILAGDIDADYCAGNTCLGEGIFWNPPSGATGTIEVQMTLDKSVFSGSPNDINFTIIKDDGTLVECGTTTECSFSVSKVPGGHFLITAFVDPIDPRGFAS